jgi:hypothetical protein
VREMRIETGPYKPPGERWTGIFIRGDEAQWYASIFSHLAEREEHPLRKAVYEEQVAFFRSCLEKE